MFYEGHRDVNVKQVQLRMRCSKLNLHLFLLHVADSPSCACGFDVEDSNHFLLECPLFNAERQTMLQAISVILDIQNLHEETLLFGSDNCDLERNKLIFRAVHQFIKDTKRL